MMQRVALDPTGLPATALAARELLATRFDIRRELARGRAYLSFESERAGRRGTVLLLAVDCSATERALAVDARVRELAAFDHPSIAAVLSHGIEHDVPWVEMQAVEGRTLAEHVAHGPVSRDRAIAIALDILEALSAAHLRGHFHGELAPADVGLVVDRTGTERVRIVGLGLASIVRDLGHGASDVEPSERDRYVAPERRRGAPPDAKGDVYSVAALLYRMITDEVPPPPPIVAAFSGNPFLPRDLEPVFLRALATDPFERYESVEDLARELRHALGARRPLSSRPVSMGRRALARPNELRPLPIAAASLAALALAFGVTFAWSVSGDAAPERAEQVVAERPVARAPTPEPGPAPAATPLPPPERATELDVPAPSEIAIPEATDLARDPLDGELPEPLASAWGRVSGGERLRREDVAPLYRWSREHPRDPRPHLILGDGFVDLGWHTDAITRYRTAIELDPNSKAHHVVLESLVLLTFEALVAEDAMDTIVELYGSEALTAVEAALASAEEPSDRARLEALAARLARL